MDRTVILLAVALTAGACSDGMRVSDLPFNYGNYGGGPRTPPPRELRITDPRLTPDGSAIVFAFRYKQYNWKIALASTDPKDPNVRVLRLPPMDNWLDPAFAPDPAYLAVVSYCTHDKCYEGAKGFNVWRITAQPTNNLKRITPDAPDVRRAGPVFGATIDDLYWFVSDDTQYPKVRLDVSDRYLAHMADGKETVVFPALPANGDIKGRHGRKDPGDLVVISTDGAGRYDEAGYYFTGMIAGGTSKAAEAALDKLHKYDPALFRHTPGGFELVEPVAITHVDAPRGNRGYVAEHRRYTRDPSVFHAVRDGQTLWSFSFQGPASNISTTDDLTTIVFASERGHRDDRHWVSEFQDTVLLWRQGMTDPIDLNIPERVKATVEAEIAAERAAAGPSTPSPTPTP